MTDDKSSLSTAHSGSSSGSEIPSTTDDINVFSSVYELSPYLNVFLIFATSLYKALMAENKMSTYVPFTSTSLEGFVFRSLSLSAISMYLSGISLGSTPSMISFAKNVGVNPSESIAETLKGIYERHGNVVLVSAGALVIGLGYLLIRGKK